MSQETNLWCVIEYGPVRRRGPRRGRRPLRLVAVGSSHRAVAGMCGRLPNGRVRRAVKNAREAMTRTELRAVLRDPRRIRPKAPRGAPGRWGSDGFVPKIAG